MHIYNIAFLFAENKLHALDLGTRQILFKFISMASKGSQGELAKQLNVKRRELLQRYRIQSLHDDCLVDAAMREFEQMLIDNSLQIYTYS
jgi:hypothetical protein